MKYINRSHASTTRMVSEKKKQHLFEDTQVFLFIFLTFEWQYKWKKSKSWEDLVDVATTYAP